MINYLEKYNNLPKELKDKISAPHVMSAMHELEEQYGLSLAALIMRVMVKDLHIDGLQKFLVENNEIDNKKAGELVADLKRRIFSEIANYIDYISVNNEIKIVNNTINERDDYSERFGLNMDKSTEEHSDSKKGMGADFYFSIEDEDEVRTQAKDFSTLDKREQIAIQVESKIDEIIGEINVIFSSEDMLRRLRQVLKTYLRGVRDKIDTKQALEREIHNGGLGLDQEISDDILKIVDILNADEAKHPGRIHAPKKFLLPEDKAVQDPNGETIKFGSNLAGQDVEYDFSQLAKRKAAVEEDASAIKIDQPSDLENDIHTAEMEKVERESKLEAETEEIERKRMIEAKEKALVLDLSEADNGKVKKSEAVSTDESEKKDKEETIAETPSETPVEAFNPGMMARARNKPSANLDNSDKEKQFGALSGKIKMEDIKKVTKLGGPLEELGSMNLVDFRRLSRSPKEAATKIMAMFNLLEEEGFNKRMLGLKSWRQNPLNKLYLSIGQESLVKKKDIRKIIEARKSENLDYLSQEEFDAIMELNKKLRY